MERYTVWHDGHLYWVIDAETRRIVEGLPGSFDPVVSHDMAVASNLAYEAGGQDMEERAKQAATVVVADMVAEARAQAAAHAEAAQALGNLLAVIHRDGGQFEAEYGPTKAAKSAEALYLQVRGKAEECVEAARVLEVMQREEIMPMSYTTTAEGTAVLVRTANGREGRGPTLLAAVQDWERQSGAQAGKEE